MMNDPVVSYVVDVERRARASDGVLEWFEIILVSELGSFKTMREKAAFMRGMFSMKNLIREGLEQKGIIIVRVQDGDKKQ